MIRKKRTSHYKPWTKGASAVRRQYSGRRFHGLFENHRYRGPKQPVFIRNIHRYVFNFYVLDSYLELDCNSRKKELLAKMQGHVVHKCR